MALKAVNRLDVCCGTGTLGLSLAASVKRVIGIEICVPAVEDARANALRNGVTNASFVASKAENATRRVLETLTDDEQVGHARSQRTRSRHTRLRTSVLSNA